MKTRLLKLLKDKEFIFSTFIFILLFLSLIYPYRDYDWGWHFRYGQYFLKTGHIMFADAWTWDMRGYVWINHEWLYDPLVYIIFSNFSFLGMSLAGAIAGFIPFVLLIKKFKLSYWQKGILAYFYFILTGGVYWQGLRSQVLGNTLLAVCLFLLMMLYEGVMTAGGKFSLKKQYPLFIFPPFFLLWANLHGGFTMGVMVFAVFLVSAFLVFIIKNIRDKSGKGFFVPMPYVWMTLCFVISVAVTFINPFTYQVYFEALKHTDSFLLKYILEWDPAQINSFFYFIFILFSIFIFLGVIIRRKLSDLPLFITSFIFFCLSLSARRYNAEFVTVSLPLGALALRSFNLRLERFKTTAIVSMVFLAITAEILFFEVMPPYHLIGYTFKDYCRLGPGCSEGLTSYLLKNPPKGDGFNFYDWGGYLIGRGIKANLFIDGRMHLWEGPNNFYPFWEYEKMFYEADFKKFNYYNFDWVIIPEQSILSRVIQKTPGWRVMYKDDNALYAVRERKI